MSQVCLILAIILGGCFGYYCPESAKNLKPFGDIFLNLILVCVVPLVFFSVSSAIARSGEARSLKRLFSAMGLAYGLGSLVAGLLTWCLVQWIPVVGSGAILKPEDIGSLAEVSWQTQMVALLSVTSFSKLFSHENMLPLIMFAILLGFASRKTGSFQFLKSGEELMIHVMGLVMRAAPIGFFAYFAVLIASMGAQLAESYVRVIVVYHVWAVFYFGVVYSVYAVLADSKNGLRLFWSQVSLPMTTALATCSSVASIPANLSAAQSMRLPAEVYETTTPIGSVLFKTGSVIGGMLKIAFLFGLYHQDLSTLSACLLALAVSMLVGTVMGAIPGGGMLGEMLILNVYGFPGSALMTIVAISMMIDSMATMLSVTGNTVANMLIARWVRPKDIG